MKDSGVEWIGEIPTHWEMKKVKAFLRERSEKNHADEEVLSLYRDFGVIPKHSRSDNHNVTSQDTSSYKFVKKDNVVINKMKAWQGSLAVSKYQGIISPAYYIYEIKNTAEIVPEFLHYSLRNPLYIQVYKRLSAGLRVGQWDLNKSEFNSLLYPIPSPEVQLKIVNFLNEKIVFIDQIIEETQQSIEEIKKYKQALITETVTKGLDKNVEMKDSRIEWVEEIPEGWDLLKLKYIANINGRIGYRGYTTNDIVDKGEGAISLSPSNIIDSKLNLESATYISWDKYEESPEIKVINNDIIFCKTGSGYGKCGIFTNVEFPSTINPQLVIIRMRQGNPSYLNYFLNSTIAQYQVETIVGGSTMPTISQEKLLSMNIIWPDLNSQNEIVDYLDEQFYKLHLLIKEKEVMITELESYKKSLICEYVTGKKEV